jgi:hypothetical protein
VPVRIVFRGLMLFTFPQDGPNAGKFVASLINPAAGGTKRGVTKPSRRGPRDHRAEIQIMNGASPNDGFIPKVLNPGVNVDISITGGPPLRRTESFDAHVPNLETIIENGIPAVRKAGRDGPPGDLIQNVVTVDRGLIRVKDVMAWDEGGFPLGGGRANGSRASAPVLVSFVGSSVEGHMASEVIIEADEAVEVVLTSGKKDDKELNGPRRGVSQPSHRHVPPNAVEILVTNYEPPSNKPSAWGLDFQWLFETIGYNVADLSSEGRFNDWVTVGTQYDPALFAAERAAMLEGPNNTNGQPFPFVSSTASITPLKPLASPRNPPVCPFATTTTPL